MWNLAADDGKIVDLLLAPYTLADFQASFYEKSYLHIARNRRDYYREFFSLDEFQRVLYGGDVSLEFVSVIKDGLPARREAIARKNPRPGSIVSDLLDADRVSVLFSKGCTIVFDAIPLHSASVAQLCSGLENVLRHRINANVYMTPPGSQGFAAHYDTHDAVILQVEGRKAWRIYGSPVPLALKAQPWDKKRHEAGEMVAQFETRPGDLLYIPRGNVHEAMAGESFSLHLTIGLHPFLWLDVLHDALSEAAEQDVFLRRAAIARTPFAEVSDALNRAFSAETLAASRSRLVRDFIVNRKNALDGQVEQLLLLPALRLESKVALRHSMLFEIEESATATILSFSRKSLTLPKGAATIVRTLAATPTATVESLAKLDAAALEIVRRLIQEGFAVQSVSPRGAILPSAATQEAESNGVAGRS
jgi:uncharacterized RmlC-like cupin family protein